MRAPASVHTIIASPLGNPDRCLRKSRTFKICSAVGVRLPASSPLSSDYNAFSRYVSEDYDVLYDNSPERGKDSDEAEYILRSLRENHIFGTSCTIVLCGEETRWRKFVDWEIDVTLSMEHGLVAVLLPSCRYGGDNRGTHKPDRLQDNIDSGYAMFITRQKISHNGPHFVRETVALANARFKKLIKNDRPRMLRNGAPPWKNNPPPPPFPTYLK